MRMDKEFVFPCGHYACSFHGIYPNIVLECICGKKYKVDVVVNDDSEGVLDE